jgi:hypothetical protein
MDCKIFISRVHYYLISGRFADGTKVVCLEECKPADIFSLAQLFYRQASCHAASDAPCCTSSSSLIALLQMLQYRSRYSGCVPHLSQGQFRRALQTLDRNQAARDRRTRLLGASTPLAQSKPLHPLTSGVQLGSVWPSARSGRCASLSWATMTPPPPVPWTRTSLARCATPPDTSQSSCRPVRHANIRPVPGLGVARPADPRPGLAWIRPRRAP